MKRSVTLGSVALVAVFALGGLTRACSPAADTAPATIDDDASVNVPTGMPGMPFVPPTFVPHGNKPIPETPNAIHPPATGDVPATHEVREPPMAHPADPPPPPEAPR